jgi:glutamine cyclotransferase
VVAMTISYTSDVANASKFGVFTSILIRWKGSVYKLVYKEMLAFMAVYFALNIFYRAILQGEGYEFYRNLFEGKVTKIQCMYLKSIKDV